MQRLVLNGDLRLELFSRFDDWREIDCQGEVLAGFVVQQAPAVSKGRGGIQGEICLIVVCVGGCGEGGIEFSG